jgi:DNA-binding PadR family transcriptional regulator
MTDISNAEAALLGLLAEGPMHPYQIEQEVKYRDMRFWTDLSMSSIYKLLRRLEKSGFVTRTNTVSAENRLRKLYSLSGEGTMALQKKIEALLSEPEHIRWRLDIGIYNCTLIPSKTMRDALKKYRAAITDKIKSYNALKKFLKDSNCPAHRLSLATRPVYLLKAEIIWIDSFLAASGKNRS